MLGQRVVIVTGASRGLGSQVAVACGRRGARVALLARSRNALAEVAARINGSQGQAKAWPCDVRDWDASRQVVNEIVAEWGRIDALINVAGTKVEGAFETTGRDELTETIEVNCLGPWNLIQAVLPGMRTQGEGHIVNVSSVLGKRATPVRAAYSASKAALNAMTDALRTELAGTGIYVTLVCPARLTPTPDGVVSRLWQMDEQRAADCIVGCLLRPRREVVLTVAGKVLAKANAVAPGWVDRLLVRWKDR